MAISKIVQNSLSDTISLGPKITSVQVANSTYVVKDDTNINIGGGYIVITGSGFQSNCSVIVDSNLACSVAFVSATQVRAELPAKPAGTYNIYLLNGDGGTAIRVNALQYSNTPTWVTTSPLADQAEDSNVSIQLSASGANTYALQSGSTLPTGLTLSANGLISGTVNTNVSVATTYNFTVEAIDTELQETPKAFAVTITVDPQIARSLRFNSADSAYLSRTPGSASNRKTWTWSGWVKRSKFDTFNTIFCGSSSGNSDTTFTEILFRSDQFQVNGYNTVWRRSTAVYRDVSAWYHLVVAFDTTQATASNRVKLYVNGTQVTDFAISNDLTQNTDYGINQASPHSIGSVGASEYFDGYMAEIHFVDGQALTPDTFGEWNNKFGGTWVPKTVTGLTYGTNGFYLPFTDNSGTTSTTLGKDYAGSNNWTPNNFSVTAGVDNDSLLDSPTPYGTDDGSGADVRGSYCTWNPLLTHSSVTLSNGGLNAVGASSSNGLTTGTIGFSSGKWYWETTIVGGSSMWAGGIVKSNVATPNYSSLTSNSSYAYNDSSTKYNGQTGSSYGASYTTNDVIGTAVDLDAGTIVFYKNGVSQGTAFTGISGTFVPMILLNTNASVATNFGQRPFAYTAPAGHNCLVSQNITPEINANTSSTLANSYFETILYTADTAGGKTISGLNFQPDLIWIKNRDNVENHYTVDAVRGFAANKFMRPNQLAVEGDVGSAAISNFAVTSTGFTITDSNYDTGELYYNGRTYVAWCWKAGDSNVTNNDGSVTGTVRANQTAGFSIVGFASGSSGDKTVGHGLGKTPRFIIMKARNGSSYNWAIYHASATDAVTKFFRFTTDEIVTSGGSNIWGSALPTSTVFGFTSDNGIEASKDCIAYCWAEIEGLSNFRSYVGNGSSDGPFVYTGFRPAFLMVKRVSGSSENWRMVDNKRKTFNPHGAEELYANSNAAEGANSDFADLLSNGFKLRNNLSGSNANGATYVYVAFAETPFKYARAR